MTQQELIVKQQLEIEDLKKQTADFKSAIDKAKRYFIAIGMHLNHNVLMFNTEQKKWAMNVYQTLDI